MPHETDALAATLAGLSPAERDSFARAYAERAFALGLTYLGAEGPRPIPVAMPPVVEPRARTGARAEVARGVTASLAIAARHILDGALGADLAGTLLSELAPLEREIVAARYDRIDALATARVDLFVDPDGIDRVLEINATIPAMQGYSDIAARAFVQVACERLAGLPAAEAERRAEAILEANGSNADDLLASLLACNRKAGGPAVPSIALIHRPNDSQLGELRYLAGRFRAAGYDARTVVSDEVRLDPAGAAVVGDFRPDLLYRHVFARRVDPNTDLATILRAPDRHRLFNPVDPHLEQKSMLAELSAASLDPSRASRLGLREEELERVRAHVPWTRRMAPGPTTDPAGETVADLVPWTKEHRAALVLKRSWDFGGKGVFLGAEYGDESSRTRARERFGRELGWDQLVEACAAEGGWVVQRRVPLTGRSLWIATPEGAVRRDVFVDVSAYTNLGVESSPRGGVCRASGSPIVNIQSGGGVVPLLSTEAAGLLAAAIR